MNRIDVSRFLVDNNLALQIVLLLFFFLKHAILCHLFTTCGTNEFPMIWVELEYPDAT